LTTTLAALGERAYHWRRNIAMGLIFEWDPFKARRNQIKHGISFEEAASVFGDAWSISIPDPQHSGEEERWVTIGKSRRARVLVVVHTERDSRTRIISARKASTHERKTYEEGA
jgi:hypothetical protein